MKKRIILLKLLILGVGILNGQERSPLAPLLAGENIGNAIVLPGSLPINTSGSTAGYFDDYDEACPYTGSTAPDVVYSFTPSSSVSVDIDLCGSSFDTKVYVYENGATPGNPYACNDDFYSDEVCGLYVSKIEEVDLTEGNTYFIVIDGYSDADFGDYVLAITEVMQVPTCPAPVSLLASNISFTTANIGWIETGNATAWEYQVGIAGFIPAATGTAVSINPKPISGLSANTTYDFYVRSDCGSEFSSWSGPATFSTLCNDIASLPFNEGFEAAWSPGCWADPETAEYGWDRSVFGAPHSGSQWAYCNLANSQLTTPGVNLSVNSRLVFWYRVEDAAYPQDMAVKIGNDIIYQISGDTSDIYRQVQVSLIGYIGQTVSISFEGQTGTGGVDFGICLDDVSVISIENYWTGNVSANWNDSGNWSAGIVPWILDVVTIPSAPSGGNFPEVGNGVSAECHNLTLSAGAIFKIKNGGTLTVLNP
jgi:hypothetical protein